MVDLKDLTTPEPKPERPGAETGIKADDTPDTDGPRHEPSVHESLDAIRARLQDKADDETMLRAEEAVLGNGTATLPPDTGPLGLEFEPVVPPRPRGRTGFRLFMAFVALIVVGAAAAWYLLGDRLDEASGGNVPVVAADPGPVKVRPDSPGGMEVPNRDKLVYNRIRSGDVEPKVERLLPPPEEPVEKPMETPVEAPEATMQPGTPPAPPSAPAADTPVRSPRQAMPEQEQAAPAPSAPVPSPRDVATTSLPKQPEIAKALEETPVQPKVEAPAPAPAPAPTAALERALAPKPAPAPATPPAATPAPAMTDGYKVQLAAVRTQVAAEKEWTRIQKSHPDLLGALALDVQRADLGAKGVFYRLRAGPVSSEAGARTICAELKKRKQGCLVVHPGK